MSKATYPLKLPTSIKAAAVRLAKEDGVSLNRSRADAADRRNVHAPVVPRLAPDVLRGGWANLHRSISGFSA